MKVKSDEVILPVQCRLPFTRSRSHTARRYERRGFNLNPAGLYNRQKSANLRA
jgi:hypothetical protein